MLRPFVFLAASLTLLSIPSWAFTPIVTTPLALGKRYTQTRNSFSSYRDYSLRHARLALPGSMGSVENIARGRRAAGQIFVGISSCAPLIISKLRDSILLTSSRGVYVKPVSFFLSPLSPPPSLYPSGLLDNTDPDRFMNSLSFILMKKQTQRLFVHP